MSHATNWAETAGSGINQNNDDDSRRKLTDVKNAERGANANGS